MCPVPLELPSYLPPGPKPLGCRRALGLSSLHHTANSHQHSILHMELYMFQSYSLYLTHPLLHCVQKFVFYVSITALQIGSSVPSF